MRILSPLALCAALAAASAQAASPRPVRFEELAKIQRVGGFTVSSDGRQVAFEVSTPDVEANTSHGAIWLIPADGGPARHLTSGLMRDSDPRFSPDGTRLGFLSNREGSSQIWTLDLSGGDPVQATTFPTGVNEFTWSPDGKWFVITSDVFSDCADTACLEKTLQARATAKVKGRVAERLLFRHWDRWKDGTRTHIWKVPVAGGAPVDLTPGNHDAPPFSIGGAADWDVSPDGRELVFAALVSHDGTFDTVSANIETEELWFSKAEFRGWPWDSKLYEKWNPMLSAANMRTPTLIVTSERDYRVPFGQGLQFFTALQVLGVPSKLLTFPDEGHWVLKPGNSCLWHNTVMDWLHRYLGGAEADPKGLALVYSVTE